MINNSDIFNASILIVDDQEADILLMRRMLGEVGYQCVAFTLDPNAVCALHRANHYDLILLDLQMPGMDGFQIMADLKEVEQGGYVPILVIAAEPLHKLRALASGAKDFLSKPFDLVEAQIRIRNMVELRLLYNNVSKYNSLLEPLAMRDFLTGLPNRRLLMDRLALAIAHARRNNGVMAVLYMDLDGFKQINDTLGHDAGDALLIKVAERLTAAVRREDTVARMGGDEFLIALCELSCADGVSNLVSKVMETMSEPFSIQNRSVRMTASVGVGIYPTHGEEVETLMKSADQALYEAKGRGKNGYRIASETRPVPPGTSAEVPANLADEAIKHLHGRFPHGQWQSNPTPPTSPS